jgi:hypothetical protein
MKATLIIILALVVLLFILARLYSVSVSENKSLKQSNMLMVSNLNATHNSFSYDEFKNLKKELLEEARRHNIATNTICTTVKTHYINTIDTIVVIDLIRDTIYGYMNASLDTNCFSISARIDTINKIIIFDKLKVIDSSTTFFYWERSDTFKIFKLPLFRYGKKIYTSKSISQCGNEKLDIIDITKK